MNKRILRRGTRATALYRYALTHCKPYDDNSDYTTEYIYYSLSVEGVRPTNFFVIDDDITSVWRKNL